MNPRRGGVLLILLLAAMGGLGALMAMRTEAFPTYDPCGGCHPNDSPTTWISVAVVSETDTAITYDVAGSNNYDRPEAWGVFDPSGNNVANGMGTGSFTLNKDGNTYRVYWVDDADTNLNNPPSSTKGGSAYQDVTTLADPPVGGIAELPELARAPAAHSDSLTSNHAAVAGGLAVAVFAITAGTWYARRRSGR